MFRGTICAGATVLATTAHALPPLESVDAVRNGLITAAIAYEISEVCPGIDVRLLRGIAYLEGLKGEARRLGYSRDEIDDFIEDKAAKARLEASARAQLEAKGAVRGDANSHCQVGQAEISANSQIGRLLR